MRVPQWLTLAVAGVVIIFGSYRIWLAFKPTKDTGRPAPRRGLYAMAKRTHFLIGFVYLLLGGALVATSFGWNPFGDVFGPNTETPSKDKAPVKGGIPVDQLPSKKPK